MASEPSVVEDASSNRAPSSSHSPPSAAPKRPPPPKATPPSGSAVARPPPPNAPPPTQVRTDGEAKEESDRKAKEEADRKATEERDRRAKEEADRNRPPPPKPSPPTNTSTRPPSPAPPSQPPTKVRAVSQGEKSGEDTAVEGHDGTTTNSEMADDHPLINSAAADEGDGAADPTPNNYPEDQPIIKKGHSVAGCSTETLEAGAERRLTDEVHIPSIQHYLIHSVQKITTLKGTLPHIIFLAIFTFTALAAKIDRHAADMTVMLSSEQVFDESVANKVQSYSDALNFIETSMTNALTFETRMRDPGELVFHEAVFVGLLSIRVHRGRLQTCREEQHHFLPRSEAGNTTLPTNCLQEDEEDLGSGAGTNYSLYAGHTVRGELRSSYKALSNPISNYNTMQIEAPFNISSASLLSQYVSELRTMLGNRSGTILAIVTEAIIFDVTTGGATHLHYVYEQQADATRSTILTFPFNLVGNGSGASSVVMAQFVCDILLGLFALYLLAEVIHHLYLNIKLLKDTPDTWLAAIGWWECFTVFLVILLTVTLGIKYKVWTMGSAVLSLDPTITSNKDLFAALVDYRDWSEVMFGFVAWTLMLGWLRSFMFLRFSFRLSIINETIGSSLHEMIGVLLIFLLVFAAYSYAGTILWGHERPEMHTMTSALNFLVLLLWNGEADNYDEFDAADNVNSKIYFASFFLLSWVVMLNVIVGVLALSFASVTETLMMMRRPEWTPQAVWRDLRKFATRLNPSTFWGQRYSLFVEDRLALLQAFQLWQWQGIENTSSGEEYISLKKFMTYGKGGFEEMFLRVVFLKSTQQVGTDNARLRQLRLNHRAINNGLLIVERLKNQSAMVDSIHRKVCVQKALDASTNSSHSVLVNSPSFKIISTEVMNVARRLDALRQIQVAQSPKIVDLQKKVRRVSGLMQTLVSLILHPSAGPTSPGLERQRSLIKRVPDSSASAAAAAEFLQANSSFSNASMILSAAVVGRQHSTDSLASPVGSTAGPVPLRSASTLIQTRSRSQYGAIGGTEDDDSDEEEDPRMREARERKEGRQLMIDESDTRYDLRTSCLMLQQALFSYIKRYLDLARREAADYNKYYKEFRNNVRQTVLRVLEERRQADESRRAAILENFERAKTEALVEQETQRRQRQEQEVQERLAQEDVEQLRGEVAQDMVADDESGTEGVAASSQAASPSPSRSSKSVRNPLAQIAATQGGAEEVDESNVDRNDEHPEPIQQQKKPTAPAAGPINPLATIGSPTTTTVARPSWQSTIEVDAENHFQLHLRMEEDGFPTLPAPNDMSLLFQPPTLPASAQRSVFSQASRRRTNSPPPPMGTGSTPTPQSPSPFTRSGAPRRRSPPPEQPPTGRRSDFRNHHQ